MFFFGKKSAFHTCTPGMYVGQTKRRLYTRVQEYSSDINKKTGSLSVISDHRIKFTHNFDWKDMKILDIKPLYNKKLIPEMHIKK